MNDRAEIRGSWSVWHFVAAAALVAWGAFITRDAWADLLKIAWVDEESSHVLLVPIAVAWIAWVRRARFRQCAPDRSFIGVAIIGLAWLLWSVGYRRDIQSFWHAGAVLMAVGCFVFVTGKAVFFRFLPAFAVLAFAIPVPGTARFFLAIPLQTATAQVTQAVLELMGVAVDRSGNLLSVNGQGVAIAEACNGMRMVFTLILVSYIFAFTTPVRGYVRFLILAASPLMAIVCNVIRLVPTVWLYGYASADFAELFHDLSGWVMLVVAFGILASIIRVLRWAMLPVTRYTLAGV